MVPMSSKWMNALVSYRWMKHQLWLRNPKLFQWNSGSYFHLFVPVFFFKFLKIKRSKQAILLPIINLDVQRLRISKKCIRFLPLPDQCHVVAIVAAIKVALYWLPWVLVTTESQQKGFFYKCQLIQQSRKIYEGVTCTETGVARSCQLKCCIQKTVREKGTHCIYEAKNLFLVQWIF